MQYEFLVKKKSVNDQLKYLFENNKEEFNNFLASNQSKKTIHADLERLFIDSNGTQYYKFPKKMELPLLRKGQLNDYYGFMASGISGQEQDEIIKTFDSVLSEGIGKPETAAKIGAMIHIMKERRKFCFHSELMLNIIAVQAIREDETPDMFNNEIQLEKVGQFKAEIEKSNAYFFFVSLQLPTPIDLSKTSLQEFTTLWHESEVTQIALPKILNLIAQVKESLKTKKSSATS